MPSVLLSQSLAVEESFKTPWPQDVKLYQPHDIDQILLPESANCLALQAFLNMCHLRFSIETRKNAEFMSPTGRVPFIKCGLYIIAEFEPVVSFISPKGISLSKHLDVIQRADMRAFMSLINVVLLNAELFVTWCDEDTYNYVTKPRYGSVFPWPLNHIQCWIKRKKVSKQLDISGWASKKPEDVYEEVNACCKALSERLNDKKFFFGGKPTELDALAFGHVFSILTTPLPNNKLATIVRQYVNLIELCKTIEGMFFDPDSPNYEKLPNNNTE